MNKYINFIKFAMLFVLVVTFSACGIKSQSFVETSYDSIKTANVTVNELMTKAGEMYQEGKLSESKKEKIDQMYQQYRAVSDLADSALAAYKRTQDQDDKQKVLDALAELEHLEAKIKVLINKLMEPENEK